MEQSTVEWFRNNQLLNIKSAQFHQTLDFDLAVLEIPLDFNGSNFTATATHMSTVDYTVVKTNSPTFQVIVQGNIFVKTCLFSLNVIL